MNVCEKLAEARVLLQESNAKKSGKNKFAGFSYYELSDFLPLLNNIFKDLKLITVFSINSNEASLEIINAEKPDEKLEFRSHTAKVEMKGCTAIQGVGAEHTYMKRYLYLNALEIVEHDALDATAGSGKIGMDYKKTIEDITDVESLNKAYKFLIDNAKDDSWKKPLLNKSDLLFTVYNKSAGMFEYTSA